MFDIGFKQYDLEREKRNRKLRDAWEIFYTPMQLSEAKFRIKVAMRIRRGKFPAQ